ncbi:MAG: MFS transporter, partial [Halobaculum sp.]
VSPSVQKLDFGKVHVGRVEGGGVDRTVLKYYAFEVTRNAHLSGPIWVLFLLSRGVSYTGVGTLDAVYSLTVLLAETPTGYVGDRLGRKRSLALGVVGTSLGSLWFAFAQSLPEFLLAYAVLAVAQTFTSGSDSAWLYDTLRARTDEDRYARIRGRGRAVGLVVSAVAAVAGGLVGEVSLAVPWIASGVLTAAGLPVVFSFPAPDHRTLDDDATVEAGEGSDDATAEVNGDDDGSDGHTAGERSETESDAVDAETATDVDEQGGEPGPFAALVAARDQLFAPPLRWFVAYTAVFAGIMGVLNFFVQPVTLDAVPELPRVAGFQPGGVVVVGLVFAAFRLIAAVVTSRTGWIADRVGEERWFLLAPPLLGGAFAAVTLLPLAAVPLFFVLRTVRSVSQPLQSTYLNDRVTSVGRATTLSAVSMAHAVVVAPIELLGGRVGDLLGTIDALAALGGALAVVAVAMQVGRWTVARVRSPTG